MSDENVKPKMVRRNHRKPPGYKPSQKAQIRKARRRNARRSGHAAPTTIPQAEKPAVKAAVQSSGEKRLREIATAKGHLTRREQRLLAEFEAIQEKRAALNTERNSLRERLGKPAIHD